MQKKTLFLPPPLRNIMSESFGDSIKTRDQILHHHQNTTALSCTRDQNQINNTQLLWCNIHNQTCGLLTKHAMSAIYKRIRLQHLQTLFAYTGILYIQCICIYIYTTLASHIEIYPVMPPVLKETKSSVLSASHSQFEGKKSCT